MTTEYHQGWDAAVDAVLSMLVLFELGAVTPKRRQDHAALVKAVESMRGGWVEDAEEPPTDPPKGEGGSSEVEYIHTAFDRMF